MPPVSGLMMSNLSTSEGKPTEFVSLFLMRHIVLSLGAYDLVHMNRGLIYGYLQGHMYLILESFRGVTLARPSQALVTFINQWKSS